MCNHAHLKLLVTLSNNAHLKLLASLLKFADLGDMVSALPRSTNDGIYRTIDIHLNVNLVTNFSFLCWICLIKQLILFSKYLPQDRKERKETNLHYPGINGFGLELNVFRSYTSCQDLPIYLCFLGVSVPVGGGHAGFYLCFLRHATPQSNNLLDETIVATKRTQDGGTEVVEATTGKGSATFSKASFLNYILNKLGWVTCNHV
ncbi:putative malate dehydrogenase [Helianthus annuus]|nr:putative malate dehydrogenase [Helianthus annuus]